MLAQQLSGVYAGYQEAAGKAAGVEAGETWQVAFRAAVAAGAPPPVTGCQSLNRVYSTCTATAA